MKIGIIGCGYVGQAVALYWKQQGHRIGVTTRQPERVAPLAVFADDVFLLRSQTLSPFIKPYEALLISVAPDHRSDYAATYLETARQVAEQTSEMSLLRQILYTSSTSVYGDHGGAWVDENTPIQETHGRRDILYQTENIFLKCSSKDLNVCVLRLGEIYGPGREIEHRLRRMQDRPLAGTGASYTNLIHLTDIVSALDFALKHHLQGVYNLCNDIHVTRSQLYDSLCKREQLPPMRWDPTQLVTHGGNKRVSNQKLKDEGWRITVQTPLLMEESMDFAPGMGND